MKINPIKTFSYKDNTLKINESTFKYSGEVDNEVLESLISKRAYATTLLYLNSTCNLESINEKEVSKQELSSYLDECMNLLESRSKLIESIDAKPLCSINKLELMEDNKNIYRGKAGKMYVELTEAEVLKEDSYEEPFFAAIENALIDAGFEVDRYTDAGVMTKNLGWVVSNHDGNTQLSCDGTWLDDEDDDDEDDLNEEAEGTQTTDVAEKKDQDLGTIKPKKTSKFIATESTFKVPYNHGFKGFTLTEDGKYVRGNYILINENGEIRAINKNKLEEDTNIDLLYKTLHLDQDLEKAMVKGASKVLYINEDEVKDYCSITFEEDEDNNYVRVYFLAEVSYEEGTKIIDNYLNNIIKKYDKDAYFEAETSGRWYALVRKERLN